MKSISNLRLSSYDVKQGKKGEYILASLLDERDTKFFIFFDLKDLELFKKLKKYDNVKFEFNLYKDKNFNYQIGGAKLCQ